MTTTTEIQYNINAQTCRVCLETPQTSDAEASLCLQDEIEYNDLKVELWQLLEAVSKVKCTRYDSIWPKQMCQNCTRRLIVAYEFMREVEKSQQILQELYEQEKLKQDDELSQDLARMDELHVFQTDTNDIDHQAEIESVQGFLNYYEYVLDIHQAEHKQKDDYAAGQSLLFNCESCPQLFDESNSLERHAAVAHSQTVQEEVMQTCPWKQQEPANKPHPYKCGVCCMDFKSGALLTVHRNNMSHYNYEKINYGDPFGESQKKKQENHPDDKGKD
ncbi:uncharacterized protein [Drosophila tropicalis]|uniref:uncharacterized protein n=1 Tax=Drosophila tropicalis TaxID=46794 RepID=UPI0035AC2131